MKKNGCKRAQMKREHTEAERKEEGREETIRGSVYDDVFRTMLDKMPQLVIPLVNEIFSQHYSEREPVTTLQNEHMELTENKVVTDSYLQIGEKYYHMECQSSSDGTMAVRMIEYDFLIALKHVRRVGYEYTLRYPDSCVLYLRHRKGTPEFLTVHVLFPGGMSIDYRTPILKVNEYSFEEIFEKKLLFFLPYYIMRYEEKLLQIQENEEALAQFLAEYRKLYETLYDLKCSREITDYEFTELKQLILKIVNWVAWENEVIRKGVEQMGGKVLEFEHDILMRESEARGVAIGEARGVAIGMERGEKSGEAKQTVALIESFARNAKVSIEEACRMADIPVSVYRNAKTILLRDLR